MNGEARLGGRQGSDVVASRGDLIGRGVLGFSADLGVSDEQRRLDLLVCSSDFRGGFMVVRTGAGGSWAWVGAPGSGSRRWVVAELRIFNRGVEK